LAERAHALGYAALALTDECSVAGVVRGHLAARDAGFKFIVGSEFTLADGLKIVLYATDRASYGDLAQLITRGRRNAVKGSYALTRDDVVELAPRCPALWIPSSRCRLQDSCTADACWFADVFAGRGWIAAELLARSGDRARLMHLQALARETGLPLVAAGDVHMRARAARRRNTLAALACARRLRSAATRSFPMANGTCARARAWPRSSA
jgi:error-prone DNA polymerase